MPRFVPHPATPPVVAACILLAACGSGTPGAPRTAGPAPWFTEEARARGIDFTWRSGHEQKFLFPEIMGGGAALFDLEQDGDLDLYFVQGGSVLAAPDARPGNQLYRNRGDGRFEDVSAASGADDRGYGMGVAAGDVDENGSTDLYVTNLGANVLLANRGDLTFADATGNTGDPSWSTSAAFADLDRDGDLDLYVANYVRWSLSDERVCYSQPYPEDYCSPRSYDAPAPDSLFRNDGRGSFSDVSAEAGLRTATGNGLGVLCSDFDGDGWTDVFVANDGMLNQLWRNRGGLRFEDVAVAAGCAADQDGRTKAGMGVAAGDLDFDGDEDLLVVNLGGESDSYYRNDGRVFSDRTPVRGLASTSRPFTRFGVGLMDFDQDGWLDLYQANGRVTRSAEVPGPRPYDEANLLMRGGGERFEEVLPRGGTERLLAATSRAAAFGDVDGDGAVDVVVVNRDAPAHLLANRVGGRGHWIAFHAREASGRDALGALLETRVDGRRIRRCVRSAYSYCAASSALVHLGLGASTSLAADVRVLWADGVEELFPGPFAGDARHELRRGSGRR
jgi:hypothetical protein